MTKGIFRQLNMDELSFVSGGELDDDTKLNLAFEVSMYKGSGYSRDHFQQIISEYYTPEEVEYCMKIWDMDIWA